MFDWKLFLVLVLVCVPGVLIVLPGMLSSIEATGRKRLPEGKELPRRQAMPAHMGGQALAVIALAAARLSRGTDHKKSWANWKGA